MLQTAAAGSTVPKRIRYGRDPAARRVWYAAGPRWQPRSAGEREGFSGFVSKGIRLGQLGLSAGRHWCATMYAC